MSSVYVVVAQDECVDSRHVLSAHPDPPIAYKTNVTEYLLITYSDGLFLIYWKSDEAARKRTLKFTFDGLIGYLRYKFITNQFPFGSTHSRDRCFIQCTHKSEKYPQILHERFNMNGNPEYKASTLAFYESTVASAINLLKDLVDHN